MITQRELKEWVSYNPESGIFTAIKKSKGRCIGDICGSSTKRGYLRFNVCGFLGYSHRFAFLYMTGSEPTKEIDHINHIKNDNRWCNLRDVTHKENHKNKSLRSNNKHGCHGIRKMNGCTKWSAVINVNGKARVISSHVNKSDAILVRKNTEAKYGFHINHGKSP